MEDLAAANARITELEGQVSTTSAERDAARAEHQTAATRLAELEPTVTTLQSDAEQTRTVAGAAQAESLGHLRRAILAEQAGQVVPELVRGTTAEELTASVEVAKSAYARATEAARQGLKAEQVP